MSAQKLSAQTLARVAENKIQAAILDGEFERLPGLGKPFEFDEREYDPHWWVRRKLERENLKVKK